MTLLTSEQLTELARQGAEQDDSCASASRPTGKPIMIPLTDSELDEIGRVEKAATRGPWCQALHVNEPRALVALMKRNTSLLALDIDGMAIVDREEDATFIVVARNVLSRLLTEVIERRAKDKS